MNEPIYGGLIDVTYIAKYIIIPTTILTGIDILVTYKIDYSFWIIESLKIFILITIGYLMGRNRNAK